MDSNDSDFCFCLTQENEGSEGANSEATFDDIESPHGRPSNLDVFPNNETMLDDELEQSATLPLRVLVFTNITYKTLGLSYNV